MINSPSELNIHWQVPYSNEIYPVVSYYIQIVNMSSGDVLASVLFDDEVKHCQILTVSVTAINALGSSGPGSASMGVPIGNHIIVTVEENTDIFYNLAPHHFDMGIDVDVAFLRDGAPLAIITFKVSLPLEIRVLWKEIFVASKIWDIFH